MRFAYIDSSWLIHISFEDADPRQRKRLAMYQSVFAAELLLAEVISFCKREKVEVELISPQFESITFVIPDRSLRQEMQRIIELGYVRGADLWHVACAHYISPKPEDLSFLTLDERQGDLAETLGFRRPRVEKLKEL